MKAFREQAIQCGSTMESLVLRTDAGDLIPLTEPSMLVGRRRGCHITLTNYRVSAHHCQLKLEADGHWYVRDLGSTNGTFVNGERITLKQLELGDELRIGTVYRFRVESGS